jgi:hypothetical protein
MEVMAMVITRIRGLDMVTAESTVAVIQLIEGIMAAVMVDIVAFTAEAFMAVADGMEAAFTAVIDKNGNILKRN